MAQLAQSVESTYNIRILDIAPAKRGFHGETWKLTCESGSYFLKMIYFTSHQQNYINSFPVIDYMNQRGINHVSRVIKTKADELYSTFNTGVVGLFEFVEGDHTEDYPLADLFESLLPIYELPTCNVAGVREDFNTFYADQFAENLKNLESLTDDRHTHELVLILKENARLVRRYQDRLALFSERNMADVKDFHITSGDVGGNVIINGDQFSIIDWDYIKLAPIERDLWPYMQDEKQIELMNSILRLHQFPYELKKDRLAYYAYLYFFYYLHEYMRCYLEIDDESVRQQLTEEIKAYFAPDYWIYGNLNKADGFI